MRFSFSALRAKFRATHDELAPEPPAPITAHSINPVTNCQYTDYELSQVLLLAIYNIGGRLDHSLMRDRAPGSSLTHAAPGWSIYRPDDSTVWLESPQGRLAAQISRGDYYSLTLLPGDPLMSDTIRHIVERSFDNWGGKFGVRGCDSFAELVRETVATVAAERGQSFSLGRDPYRPVAPKRPAFLRPGEFCTPDRGL